jgi:hypothetical protein
MCSGHYHMTEYYFRFMNFRISCPIKLLFVSMVNNETSPILYNVSSGIDTKTIPLGFILQSLTSRPNLRLALKGSRTLSKTQVHK